MQNFLDYLKLVFTIPSFTFIPSSIRSYPIIPSINQRVIYHVYPKSFCDSNGDFIGDLKGLMQKLEYLKSLGVDIVWFTPIFKSGGADGGYDIVDYKNIEECFGSLEDLKELIKKARALDMEIMLDIVLNHVSTKNEMFQKAISGDKYYQDFFLFVDSKNGKLPPTSFQSVFGGSAWEYVPSINKHYFHIFAIEQADLNYGNPKVMSFAQDVFKFWKSLGVKCFRLDAISDISKGDLLKEYPKGDRSLHDNGPKVHEYLKTILDGAFSKDDEHYIIGEVSSHDIKELILYTRKDRGELDAVYHFKLQETNCISENKWVFEDDYFIPYKQRVDEYFVAMQDAESNTVNAFESHDFPRGVSRILNDNKYRYESATTILSVQMFLPGTVSIYQGQEIGMTNANFSSLDMFDDVESKNYINKSRSEGIPDDEILRILNMSSRDNARTAMQWNSSENAGFSTGDIKTAKPYMVNGMPVVIPPKVNANYKEINFEKDIKEEKSVFNFAKNIIALRKELKVVEFGKYEMILKDDPYIFAYKRTFEGKTLLVVSNFSENEADFKYDIKGYKILLNNYKEDPSFDNLILKPYQTIIFYKE